MAAANTDKFQKVGVAGTLTSLSAPGHSVSGTTITVGSTTNWPTDTGVTFAIRQVDSSGVLVAGTYTEWRGVVSGSTLTAMVLMYGTDQVYPAGSTTQVYIPVSAARDNRLIDGLLVDHTQSGSHSQLTDANGNEWLKLGTTASAVNELTITNAATGTAPQLSATGGDTNIDLKIAPKGTGQLQMYADNGWRPGSSTWTYVSSTTFTVPAVDAAQMSVGTKIWLTQTTSKYFYVTGVSGTTITVNAGSDYTVANAAITAPYYSNAETPFGFPQYFNFTPAWTNLVVGTGGSAGNTGKFSITGKTAHLSTVTTLGSSGASVSALAYFTAPVTPSSSYSTSIHPIGTADLRDATGSFWIGVPAIRNASDRINILAVGVSTYVQYSDLSSTIPFAWASADIIMTNCTYEIA